MFDWDENNLRKIRKHRISQCEAEEALLSDAILVYEQYVAGETRLFYYGETAAGRLLGVVVNEGRNKLRVVTAYDLGARQKREYLIRRFEGRY